ncbi:MAG: GGDEF domain-containing protein, partial [Arcobacteraceae bacterium]
NRRGLLDTLGDVNLFEINLSMIVVDIDKFKNINDTYGHNVGDSVLKELSQILVAHIRENDMVARWGGEEFVVIVYTKDINVTQNVAEKLRIAIEKYDFTTVKKLTASFGVSIAKNKDESFDDIFEKQIRLFIKLKS